MAVARKIRLKIQGDVLRITQLARESKIRNRFWKLREGTFGKFRNFIDGHFKNVRLKNSLTNRNRSSNNPAKIPYRFFPDSKIVQESTLLRLVEKPFYNLTRLPRESRTRDEITKFRRRHPSRFQKFLTNSRRIRRRRDTTSPRIKNCPSKCRVSRITR